MTTKAEFNAEEWQRLAEAPALAGLIVVASQRGGTIRESLAMAKAYAAAKRDDGNDLLTEIASQTPQLDARQFSSVEELKTEGLERIRNAASLADERTTAEEADAWKRFTLDVAQRAAEADKSGGVLGIGGERVSDSEREALRGIAGALGVDPPA